MKKIKNKKNKLVAIIEEYDRDYSNNIRKITINCKDLLSGLKILCDACSLNLYSESIEEDNMSVEEALDTLETSNGDGCDFIVQLDYNDENLIWNESDYEEEEYDDDEE